MVLLSLILGFIFICIHLLITILFFVFNFKIIFEIDFIEHLIGGILVAFFIYEYFKTYFSQSINNEKLIYIQTLSGTVFIGVIWEFIEYIIDTFINLPFNLNFMTQPSVSDTMSDLFFDFAGSLIFIAINLIVQKLKHNKY